MRQLLFVLTLLCILGFSQNLVAKADSKSVGIAIGESAKPAFIQKPWAIYYKNKLPLSVFDSYDLLIFDSQEYPQLKPLSDRGKTLLGYISAGEIEKYRPYYKEIKNQGIILDENKNWPGSYFIDIRDKRWIKKIVEELVPQLLHRGFHGVFLDTLDNPIELERQNKEKYKGMRQAATTLVKAIRYHYPQIPIMVNRAYEILPELGETVTMVMGESVYASFDPKNKTYQRVNDSEYRSQVELLQNLKKSFPRLRVMTLDYWNPEDTKEIKQIYNVQRANGFEPFVSVHLLDNIIHEPK